MPVKLTAAPKRPAASPPRLRTNIPARFPGHDQGADLAASCTHAARAVAAGRLTDDELTALASAVALRVIEKHGARMERTAYGRTYLRQIARGLYLDSNQWRDTARDLAALRRKDRGEPVELERDLAPGMLADALDARTARDQSPPEDAPIRGDVGTVAALAAARVGEREHLTAARTRDVRLALIRDMSDDPTRALYAVAAANGRTYAAVAKNASEGATILRRLDPAELVALVRDAARAGGALDERAGTVALMEEGKTRRPPNRPPPRERTSGPCGPERVTNPPARGRRAVSVLRLMDERERQAGRMDERDARDLAALAGYHWPMRAARVAALGHARRTWRVEGPATVAPKPAVPRPASPPPVKCPPVLGLYPAPPAVPGTVRPLTRAERARTAALVRRDLALTVKREAGRP